MRPAWWTAILVLSILAAVLLTAGMFSGSFGSYIPVTVTSDRAGLVMEPGAKVKLRGVDVGRVESIVGGNRPVALKLLIDQDQAGHIPANVGAQIRATTAFGAKYVDLTYPDHPSAQRLAAGAVLTSHNVSTEVNTVFQNIVNVLDQIDPPKLNAAINAFADGVRGQGERIGEATTAANQVLLALNPRSEQIRADWRSFKGFSDAYNAAANDIVATLDAASTTSSTITNNAAALDALLLNTIGFAQSGVNLLAPNQKNLIDAFNTLEPTTSLLMKYQPTFTCLIVGSKLYWDMALSQQGAVGNNRTAVADASITYGADSYHYPENLPVVAAKGGPGGKPSCGSLPDVRKHFPVKKLVTNTGWGTGGDIRVNPGIGHPFFVNYFPVTRAVPEAPYYLGVGPAAPGPIPYPGAPPQGAPLYGPGGVPLWPGVPPAPAPEAAPPAAEPASGPPPPDAPAP